MQASATRIEMKMKEECDENLKWRVAYYKGENRGCTLIFKPVAGSTVALKYAPWEFYYGVLTSDVAKLHIEKHLK